MRHNQTVTFTAYGKRYTLSNESIERALKGKTPEHIRKYYIQVNNKNWPLNQVINAAAGVPKAAIITSVAFNVLGKLYHVYQNKF